MPLNIAGASLNATTANTFQLQNTSGQNVLTIAEQSNVQPFRPAFIAGRASDPSWITLGTSTWVALSNYYNSSNINVGNCYNNAGSFTAPVAGNYLFVHSVYFYVNGYIHPMFAINGFTGGSPWVYRNGFDSWPARIRQHGMVGDYQHDMQLEEIIPLNAGDTVQVTVYCASRCGFYPHYGYFAGILLG